MTTQELKTYINRVLGDNIRCLLPSYWWKRLFGLVTDQIENVELNKQDLLVPSKNIKTIDGKNILGEGNINSGIIVSSEEELLSISAEPGTIAVVATGGPVEGLFSECATSGTQPSDFTRISGLKTGIIPDLDVEVELVFAVIHSDGTYSNLAHLIYDPEAKLLGFVNLNSNGNLEDIVYMYVKNSEIDQKTLQRVNTILASKDYRYIPQVDNDTEIIDSLVQCYIYRPWIINVFVKGDTWAKMSSESSGINDEVRAALEEKQNILVNGENIKTVNGYSLLGSGNIDVGANITVDNYLSTTSANPVQNNVITLALNDKINKDGNKQLSTEDFTTELKNKLNGLSNYDDTQIENAINTLRSDFDKLVSGDTTDAIKTFNEIIAFLDGVSDSESLDNIIASIEQQIANMSGGVHIGSEAPVDENIKIWIDTDEYLGNADWDGITIDEELSPVSTNPVQNKTLYALIGNINTLLDEING